MKRAFAVAAAFALLCLGVTAQAVTIETVAVGDVGNMGDTAVMGGAPWDSGLGAVNYAYEIGAYEVTSGQYTEFLNAVAADDPSGLWDSGMGYTSGEGSGITRSGSAGSYTYSVHADYINRAVGCINFWDAVRFANWMHNGQLTGAQAAASTEYGAYTLTADGIANNTVTRNTGWTWALPTENEWYKAAYYKGGGTNAGYWLLPTQSNDTPGRDMADASGNNINHYMSTDPTPYPLDNGRNITVVGEFQNSDSAYGTFDQGGNVTEWTESIIDGSKRVGRGGSYHSSDNTWGVIKAKSTVRDKLGPAGSWYNNGFRLVTVEAVPEPSSIIALLGGLAGLAGIIRRKS